MFTRVILFASDYADFTICGVVFHYVAALMPLFDTLTRRRCHMFRFRRVLLRHTALRYARVASR